MTASRSSPGSFPEIRPLRGGWCSKHGDVRRYFGGDQSAPGGSGEAQESIDVAVVETPDSGRAEAEAGCREVESLPDVPRVKMDVTVGPVSISPYRLGKVRHMDDRR